MTPTMQLVAVTAERDRMKAALEEIERACLSGQHWLPDQLSGIVTPLLSTVRKGLGRGKGEGQ